MVSEIGRRFPRLSPCGSAVWRGGDWPSGPLRDSAQEIAAERRRAGAPSPRTLIADVDNSISLFRRPGAPTAAR